MTIYLTTYRPLRRTAPGRHAIARYGLPPFIDDSCRREPDLQSTFPSITALCRASRFAPRLQLGDIVVYMTKKLAQGRWLPAILEVIERFERHEDAATWYCDQGLPLPSNCMVEGNPPIPYDQTSGAELVEVWDEDYVERARDWPVFLATTPLHLELDDPPLIRDEDLNAVFGRVPGTQNPSAITTGELKALCQRLGIALAESAATRVVKPVIELGMRCSSKREFTDILRHWFLDTDEPTIGDVGTYGRRAWLWLRVAGNEMHLNADTKRSAVRRYLDLTETHGVDMAWHVRPNRFGTMNKICIEPDASETPGFYLYVRPAIDRLVVI